MASVCHQRRERRAVRSSAGALDLAGALPDLRSASARSFSSRFARALGRALVGDLVLERHPRVERLRGEPRRRGARGGRASESRPCRRVAEALPERPARRCAAWWSRSRPRHPRRRPALRRRARIPMAAISLASAIVEQVRRRRGAGRRPVPCRFRSRSAAVAMSRPSRSAPRAATKEASIGTSASPAVASHQARRRDDEHVALQLRRIDLPEVVAARSGCSRRASWSASFPERRPTSR